MKKDTRVEKEWWADQKSVQGCVCLSSSKIYTVYRSAYVCVCVCVHTYVCKCMYLCVYLYAGQMVLTVTFLHLSKNNDY